jgi:hypothetical protein
LEDGNVKLKDKEHDPRFETKDGRGINLSELNWFSISEIGNFNEIYYREKSRNNN